MSPLSPYIAVRFRLPLRLSNLYDILENVGHVWKAVVVVKVDYELFAEGFVSFGAVDNDLVQTRWKVVSIHEGRALIFCQNLALCIHALFPADY